VVHEATDQHMNFQTKNFSYVKKPFGEFIDQIAAGSKQYLRSLALEKPSQQPAQLAIDFPVLASDFSLPAQLEMVARNAHSSPLRISGPVVMWLHYDVRMRSWSIKLEADMQWDRSWPTFSARSVALNESCCTHLLMYYTSTSRRVRPVPSSTSSMLVSLNIHRFSWLILRKPYYSLETSSSSLLCGSTQPVQWIVSAFRSTSSSAISRVAMLLEKTYMVIEICSRMKKGAKTLRRLPGHSTVCRRR